MKSAPVNLVPKKPHPNIIEHLEYLLEQAKAGELLGIAYLLQWKGDLVSSGWVLSSMSPRRLVGELSYLQQEIMDNNK